MKQKIKNFQVQHFSIPSTTNQEAIKSDYYKCIDSADSILIFVGGDGDGKNIFDPIIKLLIENSYSNSIFAYTYRGLDEGIPMSLNQKVKDLQEVLDFVGNELRKKSVKIICTSMGAWATSKVICQSKYAKVITDVLMIDPCDYYIRDSNLNTEQAFTWSGIDKYEPKEQVLSDVLLDINSNVKISIIGLIVRNCDKKGYYASEIYTMRETDTPGLYTRLNQDMVKALYDKISGKNKGVFIQINNVPHGFMRDGNVGNNVQIIAKLIMKYLQ